MAKNEYANSSKVYVFDKKEIFLLFIFFIVTALTTFLLGMRLGKKQYQLQTAAISNPSSSNAVEHQQASMDKNNPHTKEGEKESTKEQHKEVAKTDLATEEKNKKEHEEKGTDVQENTSEHPEQAFKDKSLSDVDEERLKKLREEFSQIQQQERSKDQEHPKAPPIVESPSKKQQQVALEVKKITSEEKTNTNVTAGANAKTVIAQKEDKNTGKKEQVFKADADVNSDPATIDDEGNGDNGTQGTDDELMVSDKGLIGKTTIQIGAYKTKKEAIDFAKKYVAKGYHPMVKESNIPSHGKWFRVSLGVFESRQSAQNYVKQEKTLFSSMKSTEFVISEIR